LAVLVTAAIGLAAVGLVFWYEKGPGADRIAAPLGTTFHAAKEAANGPASRLEDRDPRPDAFLPTAPPPLTSAISVSPPRHCRAVACSPSAPRFSGPCPLRFR
jgi:hypothetical protein